MLSRAQNIFSSFAKYILYLRLHGSVSSTISKLDHTVKIVLLITLERPVQNTRTLLRYQNDDMTLLIIELYFEMLHQL